MTYVYKFGGASVKDAAGIKNLTEIINQNRDKNLLVVVSAMGKMTNALEKLANAYVEQDESVSHIYSEIKTYHEDIMFELFGDKSHPAFDEISNTFVEIDWMLEEEPHEEYDFIYDQLVSIGELLSSKIVSAYLNFTDISTKWLDARSYIHTDNAYREGNVDWKKTQNAIEKDIPELLKTTIAVTQGFIGGTSENFTTTLGREGSDYSAAIFATCLKAESLTIWKDVAGVLNADPKLFSDTVKYDDLSYRDALEMTYYGATVIHPKTIKPLQNARIPLFVKPFLSPQEAGTCIKESDEMITEPAIIVKKNQILLTVSTPDLSFITENHLANLYRIFADAGVKINTMQLSAVSFSACFDTDERKFSKLVAILQPEFQIRYNNELELLTIRHFNKELVAKLSVGKVVLLEQLSRTTAQLVLKNL